MMRLWGSFILYCPAKGPLKRRGPEAGQTILAACTHDFLYNSLNTREILVIRRKNFIFQKQKIFA